MPANYDKTAWFYDGLSRLIYGNTLNKAQAYLLKHIPPQANILIIGGGTGKILEDITMLHPGGLTITYVEVSANMIRKAQHRNAGENKVMFVHSAIEQFDQPGQFDVIITAFLFDNYTDDTLRLNFPHISDQLKHGGLWFNTDFQLTGKWWQPILLRAMYTFFKLFSRIDAVNLPDIKSYFEKVGYQLVEERAFFGKFVVSVAWRK